MLRRLLNGLREWLFPKFCAGCKREGHWLCEDCFILSDLFQKNGLTIENLESTHLDGVATLFDYGENTISRLIKMLKYNCLLEVGDVLENIINNFELENNWQDFVIIPVPLHERRERERGFNQAEILADIFSKKLVLNVDKNLQRPTYTVQQVKLTGEQRKTNLKGAFAWNGKNKIIPEKVLLVDDVFTTGATMQECAQVLKSKGVKVVWGIVLARG